ncbi:class III aminotransferase [Limnohabitans sp. MMS-10A-160]|uniref:3-keto-5-aminohexanoate cleavage protein n=1 Tax=unclassified Limnohabitans TaxID=2626134 RepID=UPI000D35BC74|nr:MULTISPECIES: 3-keto-5-aminohexanoate cleavage protein [unclassified Limnohabitans]PUE19185.1 class III aminotransferase [Limnohabitans sp. MMS-10A-192]PUE26070.1 class III aminotransferase [Limnohabitans sp. MMS-10A-160]
MAVFSHPLLITVAPNGAYKQRPDHAALPITATELGKTAKQCLDAGAAMIHMHIRDAEGRHSLDVQGYRDAQQAVKAAVGDELIIQITSEAARVYKAPEQIAMVTALKPEAVSVGLREVDQPEIGEAGLAQFFGWLAKERVMTQVIVYDVADLQRWQALRAQGVIPDAPWSLLFVLGRYSVGQTSEAKDLLPFVMAHTGTEPWSMCAFGAGEHACATTAVALGGHARVGFENNLLLNNGQVAPDNAALVRQIADSARVLGRSLYTAAQAREAFFAA